MTQKTQTQRQGVFSPLNYLDFHNIQLSFAVPPFLCNGFVKSNDCLSCQHKVPFHRYTWETKFNLEGWILWKKKGRSRNDWKLFVSSYCGKGHNSRIAWTLDLQNYSSKYLPNKITIAVVCTQDKVDEWSTRYRACKLYRTGINDMPPNANLKPNPEFNISTVESMDDWNKKQKQRKNK